MKRTRNTAAATADAAVDDTIVTNANATDTVDQTTNAAADQTDTDAADEAARAAFDAEADAARDPFYGTFTVVARTVLNSPAKAKHGDEVSFDVVRHKKGAYTARWTAGEGEEPIVGKLNARKPDVAVRSVIRAMGDREAEFMFDAFAAENEQSPIPEMAGDNERDDWFFNEDTEIAYRLNKVADGIREADTLMTAANKNGTLATLAFGRAYNTAKAIFAEAGLSGEGDDDTAKRGKVGWGVWLDTRFGDSENVKNILAKKNAAAQAGFFALAPDDVREAVGTGAASTFMRKAEEAAAEFGAAIAEAEMVKRVAEGNESRSLTIDAMQSLAAEKLKAREDAYDAAQKEWQEAATKAAQKGKTPEPFAAAKTRPALVMVRWLYTLATETSNAFDTSKLGKAIAKAWDNETKKPSEEEREEEAAKKATAAITKTFGDMSVSEAATHLLHILVVHEVPETVLETLGDMLADWVSDQEAKAKAEQAKDEAAAEAE